MEASSSAHHWARKLVALGLDARIIAAQLVSPYRKQGASGKNDANGAAAICEAAGRPQMHFVPVKSIEQQSMLCVHRLREGFKAERTACINRIRGLLAEFGLVYAKSPAALEAVLADVLEDASNEMNTLARLVLQRAQGQWRELDAHIAWCDQRIAAHAKYNDAVKKAATLMGVGPIKVGPEPQTKAVIGGFSIIEVPSRDEALVWAACIAEACRCAQEVREIMFDPES
jgi:transposase